MITFTGKEFKEIYPKRFIRLEPFTYAHKEGIFDGTGHIDKYKKADVKHIFHEYDSFPRKILRYEYDEYGKKVTIHPNANPKELQFNYWAWDIIIPDDAEVISKGSTFESDIMIVFNKRCIWEDCQMATMAVSYFTDYLLFVDNPTDDMFYRAAMSPFNTSLVSPKHLKMAHNKCKNKQAPIVYSQYDPNTFRFGGKFYDRYTWRKEQDVCTIQ